LIGGYDGTGTRDATIEVFDPAADTSAFIPIPQTFVHDPDFTSAVVDGKIYVVGGGQFFCECNR